MVRSSDKEGTEAVMEVVNYSTWYALSVSNEVILMEEILIVQIEGAQVIGR